MKKEEKKNKEYILYSDDILYYIDNFMDDIKESLNYYEIEINNHNIATEAATQINNLYEDLLSCLRMFDNLTYYNKICVCADLGLWYGRRTASKTFNNLVDAVRYCAEDLNKLYFKDNKQTLTLNASHHDGTNIFKFYKIVDGKKYAIKCNDVLSCY